MFKFDSLCSQTKDWRHVFLKIEQDLGNKQLFLQLKSHMASTIFLPEICGENNSFWVSLDIT